MRLQLALSVGIGFVAIGCASPIGDTMEDQVKYPGPKPTLTPPAEFCRDASLAPDDFCMPIDRIEPLLGQGTGEVLYHKITDSGVSRPSVIHIAYVEPDGERVVIKAKWKVAPKGGTGFNNTPDKEIAAYEAQKLFLDPDDYVVPPSVGVCVPIEKHAASIGRVKPNIAGTNCVFGVVSYWLENVTPVGARDLDRFETDAAYREDLAAMNVFTYLIGHRDARDANFLISKDPDRPRVFVIDNGLSFGGFKNPFTVFYGDWGKIRVPKIRHKDVDRLRAVTRADLDRLAVVAQFEARDGILVSVPPTESIDPSKPVRWQGGILQLGLTGEDIDSMEERIRKLLERVDDGKIELF